MRTFRTLFFVVGMALFGSKAHASPELIRLCQNALEEKAAQELPGATFDFKTLYGGTRKKSLRFTMRYFADWGFARCIVTRNEVSEIKWPAKFDKRADAYDAIETDQE